MTWHEEGLVEYISRQRWHGAKTREALHANILDTIEGDGVSITLVELVYSTGLHDVYQLVENETALLDAMRTGTRIDSAQGQVEFNAVGELAELSAAREVGAEQSNTSIVFDEELILKVFRRLEPGVNPDLEVLRFLTEHEFPNIAPLAGWYSYAGEPLSATLGLLQQFVRNGLDGWELALDEIADDPDAFLARLQRLGAVTGEMHRALASDPADPAFAPETPSVEAFALLTATVDEEIQRVFLTLAEDDEMVAPIAGRGEEVREVLRQLTNTGSAGQFIRTHGDFHLGQTMWANGDWVILDFEGEPSRAMAERRRKRSPLRDVAGMLRSFSYAASAVSFLRDVEPPEDWEEQARARFLEGYLETVDHTLLPSGQGAVERLLALFELEKAVYELRYELDHRPDWVGIPVRGIQRLIENTSAPA
jgi:trehalose synthase-fused probable maltokinase